MIECPMLQQIRNKHIILQLPRTENNEDLIKTVLLFTQDDDTHINNMLCLLVELWTERSRLINELT